MKFDIISFGSSTIDVFVKMSKGSYNIESNDNMCYHLGDKLPVEDLVISTGGGATNTSVAFSRLGLKAGIITAVGNDINGKLVLDELKRESVEFLGVVKKGKTGYSVVLPGPTDRTILVYSGVNNKLNFSDLKLRGVETKWLYISTLRNRGFKAIEMVSLYAKNKKWKIAMNMSQYLAKKGLKKLSSLLSRADVLIMNKSEAMTLAGCSESKNNLREAIRRISICMHGIIIITDGPNPIYLYESASSRLHVKKVRKARVIDATGAGDAFAAGFIYALSKGIAPVKALDYGCEEARATLKYVGAKEKLLRRIAV